MFLAEACLLLPTQLNNNECMGLFFFTFFVPYFVLGILLRLSDISNIGANGPVWLVWPSGLYEN